MKKIILLLLLMLPAITGFGGVRRFTFLYEATTSAKGALELENWVTWKNAGGRDGFDKVDVRHEIEYGVTDKFQASIYFADWSYESDSEHSGAVFSDAAVELIYNFTNPVLDPVGLSAYGEIKIGEELFELEWKLIAQKNLGKIILAYNATLEAVWEGPDLEEREGEFIQAVGASYEFSPNLSAGLEFFHEFVFPEWSNDEGASNFFIGPNVSYRRGSWFVTTTIAAQATDTDGEPDFQWRTIFGMDL